MEQVKIGEEKIDYIQFRDEVINQVSPSFCGAKWYNATVWLGSGTTASCHHPPAHRIPVEEIKSNYKALHNTVYKKLVRKQMLMGERPTECEYCWKVEDLGPDKVSDRVYKSVIYPIDDLHKARDEFKDTGDVDLQTLEIAFDANCNFACSYCNPSFSTKWMEDIKTNGAYQNLVSDGAGAYHQDGTWAQPYGVKNKDNPYIEAFWKWWETDLQHSLQELRITGGEATMSQDFWKLMDWWDQHPECKVRLAVNSNLGAKPQLIKRLAEVSHKMHDFQLYTSNESFGAHAEYIRDGLNWDTWLANAEYILEHGNVKGFHVMMTLNGLSLLSICEFMDAMLKLRKKHFKKYGIFCAVMSFNLLRFPSFMSIVTLPEKVKKKAATKLSKWLRKNIKHLHEHEVQGIERTIAYINEVDVGHFATSSLETRQRDFKTFYTQYDQRRGKDFCATFPELADWFNAIPTTDLKKLQSVIDGDSTKGHNERSRKELLKRAEKEGWILEGHSMENPGAQDYKGPVPPSTTKSFWDTV